MKCRICGKSITITGEDYIECDCGNGYYVGRDVLTGRTYLKAVTCDECGRHGTEDNPVCRQTDAWYKMERWLCDACCEEIRLEAEEEGQEKCSRNPATNSSLPPTQEDPKEQS